MALPIGPGVAFLFTDIEGSTRTERAVGSAVWAGVVARHDELMRRAIERHGGSVVKTEGDAFFAAFAGVAEAVAAAAVRARRGPAAVPRVPAERFVVRGSLPGSDAGQIRQLRPEQPRPEAHEPVVGNPPRC